MSYAIPGFARMFRTTKGERGSLPLGPFIILGSVLGVFWAGAFMTW